MSTPKKRLSALPGLVIAALLMMQPTEGAAQYQSRNLRISFGSGQDHAAKDGFDALTACVHEKSAGQMKLRVFYDGTLGNDISAMQSVRSGSLDMVLTSAAPVVGMVAPFGVFDLPFLFETAEEADRILDGKLGTWLLEQLPAVGMVGLAWWENGYRNATNSKHPIARLEDFSGLKMRVMQSPIALDVFNTLGANAVPLAYTELYSALETRTVDGQENPFALIKDAKFYEVQKYLTISKHVYTPFVLLVSSKIWERFSAEERDTLQQCAHSARDTQRRSNRARDAQTLEFLRTEGGMSINEIAPEELQRIRERIAPVQERAIKTVGQEVVDMMRAELAALRKK